MPQRTTFPWGRPRREWLVLALVALAALTPLYGLNAQDNSRLCLSQALLHGRLYDDGCFQLDYASYGGHDYSDKAPGLSIIELPVAEAVGLPDMGTLVSHNSPWQLWIVRVLSSGLMFLACAFLLGRVSEGLAPGYGSVVLVTFALGTLIAAFAAMNFDQVPAALLGFGAFLLAWRRRPLLAGLAAGAGVVFEYQVGLIVAVVAVYLVVGEGRLRRLARYALGVIPGALLLGVYDWLAFGAPWRLSYRYVSNQFQSEQASGFFGIGVPHLYASYEVFAGSGGLLAVSPVLAAAAWGLVLLGREHRREAIACAVVTVLFVIANAGYFLPYGGSPGPRFLIPALPFLALGLAPAFAWRPLLTGALALLSIVTMSLRLLVWGSDYTLRGGVWGELARVPVDLGSSRFAQDLVDNVLGWVVPGRGWGALVVVTLAVIAFAVAWGGAPRRPQVRSREVSRGARVLVVAGVCLIAAAEASTVLGYPYGSPPNDLSVSIDSSAAAAFPDQEVDFTVWSSNASGYQGYGKVFLTISLPPGMKLLGRPAYERGSGCKGKTTLVCFLDSLSPKTSTPVRLGVKITRFGDQTLRASLSAEGASSVPRASFTVGTE
ncbi:MAG TPA: hypothetical protein VLV28_10965 [Gaiellaceae bacterium]|nr:hypothetical protein [Gaiellaceae bacterium]